MRRRLATAWVFRGPGRIIGHVGQPRSEQYAHESTSIFLVASQQNALQSEGRNHQYAAKLMTIDLEVRQVKRPDRRNSILKKISRAAKPQVQGGVLCGRRGEDATHSQDVGHITGCRPDECVKEHAGHLDPTQQYLSGINFNSTFFNALFLFEEQRTIMVLSFFVFIVLINKKAEN